MASLTPKFLLRKPSGADFVNPTLDIGDNMDKIDAALGEKRRYKHTAGNLAVTNVNNPITGAGTTTADLVMKAAVGDWIEVAAMGLWNVENSIGYLDVWSRLAGVRVNSWGGDSIAVPVAGHSGLVGWRGNATEYNQISGGTIRQVVAGDIDGTGQVTLTPYALTTTNKTIFGTAAVSFQWHAINHGQP